MPRLKYRFEDYPRMDKYDIEGELAQRRRWAQIERDVIADPTRDYFLEVPSETPKQTVGEYVAEHCFSVPLIRDQAEWEEAFDAGLAMVRSEQRQDYNGMSGLFRSKVLNPNDLKSGELDHDFFGAPHEVRRKLGLELSKALRSGQLDPTWFMERFAWDWDKQELFQGANDLGLCIYPGYVTASKWRYIPGVNLKVFRDPSVDGRYHIGARDQGSHDSFCIDKGKEQDHDRVWTPDETGQKIPFDKIIEYYEAIRMLPRFDQRQAPQIELQLDANDELHFLQYLRLNQIINPIDAFPLPRLGARALKLSNVRGVTLPDGEAFRLYAPPKRITKRMKGQGFYFDTLNPREFGQQYLSMFGKFVVHWAYVCMREAHYDSAPVIRPQVAIGLARGKSQKHKKIERGLRDLTVAVHGNNVYDQRPDHNAYVDAHITSNGRQAVLEVGSKIHTEDIQ